MPLWHIAPGTHRRSVVVYVFRQHKIIAGKISLDLVVEQHRRGKVSRLFLARDMCVCKQCERRHCVDVAHPGRCWTVIFDLVARVVAVIAQQGSLQFTPDARQLRAQPLPGKDELDPGPLAVRIKKVRDHLFIDADDSRGSTYLLETSLEAVAEIGKRVIFTFCPIEDDDAHGLNLPEYFENALRTILSAAFFSADSLRRAWSAGSYRPVHRVSSGGQT